MRHSVSHSAKRWAASLAVLTLLLAAGPAGGEVVITECGSDSRDFVEIQNVSADAIDTSGWVVALNDAYDEGETMPPDINLRHSILWELSSPMAADEVRYRLDLNLGDGNFWGENIFWRPEGNGWAMIVDDEGSVADFVVWGYSTAEIASLAVNVNGFDVTAEDAWTGAAAFRDVSIDESHQRRGNFDHDDASDWLIAGETMGRKNDLLITPFIPEPSTLVLLAMGVLMIATYAWRKHRTVG